ncbi:MAG: pyruvate kinase [Planctomycetota bacterium]|nr:pyruvate kinase [Planctomycetota bacterium]
MNETNTLIENEEPIGDGRGIVPADPGSLLSLVESLRIACTQLERAHAADLQSVRPAALDGARNLLHYLALRREDLRSLQAQLSELGLSSLGRSESHVLANLGAVARCLRGLTGELASHPAARGELPISIHRGRFLLEETASRLMGPSPAGRSVRIMVTLASQAADDPTVVGKLLDAGMTVARINSAHDDVEVWRRMCRHVREQSQQRGIDCRVLFDLAGPKIRTGPLAPGPQVLRAKPQRDLFGRVTRPATLRLVADTADAALPGLVPVPQAFLSALRMSDQINLVDARGKARSFAVVDIASTGACTLHGDQTAYLISGMDIEGPSGVSTRIGNLAAVEQAIVLHAGALLTLMRAPGVGHEASHDSDGIPHGPAVITCTLPEALAALQVGDPIWFDDGKIGGVVEAADATAFHIRITDASPKGDLLRADKGINLPRTRIDVSGLTQSDRQTLPFAAEEADMVGMSFVQNPSDVRTLARELAALGGDTVGIVLKIETQAAFDHLPSLLLAAMESSAAGVMIARGDLAVELGYGRLAEVQEEILWMCEAAHVPVIWATQVLETLAKTGHPSRAEVTDAAMAVRAECVMLNKGPYIVETVGFLDGVLRRMQEHQSKKSPMLRALSVARRFGLPRKERDCH